MLASETQDQTQVFFAQAGDYIRSGQLVDAEKILTDLIKIEGVQDEAYSKLGVVYNFQKRKEDAIEAFLKSIAINQSFVPAYHNLCLVYTELGQYGKAIEYGHRGLESDPAYLELYYALALIARLQGKLNDALDYMRCALSHDEQNVRTLANYWALLFDDEDYETALVVLNKIITQNPEYALAQAKDYVRKSQLDRAEVILDEMSNAGIMLDEVYTRLGVVYNLKGHKDVAIAAFLKAITVNEDYAPAYYNLCVVYTDDVQYETAIEYGRKGLGLDPENLEIYYAIAHAYRYQGNLKAALDYTRRALALNEDNVDTLSNYSALLFEMGNKEEAVTTLKKIIGIKPNNAAAHRILALSSKYTKDDPHITQMEGILSTYSLENAAKSELHFALGKAYESTKQFEESFRHYKRGNELHRQSLNYSTEENKKLFERTVKTFSPEFIESHTLVDQQEKTPIFILGMPRSGTSLVEQILASHPDVYGAGELRDLAAIQYYKFGINLENFEGVFSTMEQSTFENMADIYLQKLASLSGDKSNVTDKMPSNFWFIGLIACLFPNAKIIHCIRDPRDVCLSIFKTYFTGHLPYAYDEHEIAQYYTLYKDIMAYWHKILPDKIYDLHYESLVNEPEDIIRGLLTHCRLEWEDACLDFHKTKRSVTTASAMQVKQPLYKSALEYWRNYEPYLSGEIKSLV